MAAALLTHVMAELISAAGGGALPDRMPPCVAGARAYLLKHYSRNVSLAELAQAYRMDRFYLQKLFKKHTGLSPKKFQLLTRVNRAKELLQATDLPVSEIAGRVGVESASRFIALFRAYEGRTPATTAANGAAAEVNARKVGRGHCPRAPRQFAALKSHPQKNAGRRDRPELFAFSRSRSGSAGGRGGKCSNQGAFVHSRANSAKGQRGNAANRGDFCAPAAKTPLCALRAWRAPPPGSHPDDRRRRGWSRGYGCW